MSKLLIYTHSLFKYKIFINNSFTRFAHCNCIAFIYTYETLKLKEAWPDQTLKEKISYENSAFTFCFFKCYNTIEPGKQTYSRTIIFSTDGMKKARIGVPQREGTEEYHKCQEKA